MDKARQILGFVIRLQDMVSPKALRIIQSLKGIDMGVSKVSKSLQRLGPGLSNWFKNAQTQAKGFRDTIMGIPDRLINLPNLIGASVVGLTFGMAIDASAFKATQSKAFELMTGSKATGDALLAQSVNFANLTPFSTRDILSTTQGLLQTFAPSDIPNLLAAVGDVAAVNQFSPEVLDSVTRTLNQINTSGKLYAQDVNQLSAALVPVGEMWNVLAKMRGVDVPTMRQIQANGGVSSQEAIFAILEAIRTKTSGGVLGNFMKEMSSEIPGLMSTLKSKPFEIFMDLDTSPVKRFLSNLVRLTDTTTKTGKRFKDAVLNTFGSVLKAVFNPLARATEPEAIITWLENMQPNFEAFGDWWDNTMPRVIDFARDFGTGFVSAFQSAWAILEPFLPQLNTLADNTANAASQNGIFAGKLAGVLTMLGLVNFATGGLAGSLASGLLPMLGQVLTKMGVWGWVIAGVSAAWVLLYNNVGWVKDGVDRYVTRIAEIFNGLKDAVTTVFDYAIGRIDAFKTALASIPGVKIITEGISGALPDLPALPTPGKALGSGLVYSSLTTAMFPALGGAAFVHGLIDGIYSGQPALQNAVDETVNNTSGRFADQMKIHSPSRVMQWQGRMLGLGLAGGILSTMPQVASAMSEFSSPQIEVVGSAPWLESASAVSTKGSRGSGGNQFHIENHFVIDGSKNSSEILAELQAHMNEIIGNAMSHAADEVDGGRSEY
jgi:tape measure domain-containing protein